MKVTRGKVARAQKCAVYGPEGIGKSTLVSMFPDPLFIDTEGSTFHMDVARLTKPSSWTMLLEEVKHVRNTQGLCKTLVIDTADWAEQLCVSHICAKNQKAGIEDFGYGKGFTYLAEEFGRLLNLLEEVVERGVHVAMTAHAKMRKFELPDELGAYDRWELKLSKTAAPLVKEWADVVLFANYKTHVVNVDGQGTQKGKNKAQGGKRVIYTSHHPCWDAKNRHGLPDELPMEYAAIAHCFDANLTGEAPPVTLQAPTQERPVSPPPTTSMPDPEPEVAAGDDMPGALTRLRALMEGYNITDGEIQGVVAEKGFFPKDTPLEKYPEDFIDGWLMTVWDKVCDAIIAARPVPF